MYTHLVPGYVFAVSPVGGIRTCPRLGARKDEWTTVQDWRAVNKAMERRANPDDITDCWRQVFCAESSQFDEGFLLAEVPYAVEVGLHTAACDGFGGVTAIELSVV